MTPKNLFDRFRSDLADIALPVLWTDVEVCSYMHDAQQKLCRLTEGLRDVSSRATQISFAAGDIFVPLDPSILRIRSAVLASTNRPVRVVSYEDVVGMDGTLQGLPFLGLYGSLQAFTTDLTLTGVVVAVIIGMEEGKLRLIRTPLTDDSLVLMIERLPLCSLAVAKVADLPRAFEVREEHHLAMLLWMKHLAYAKDDVETYDGAKSEKMKSAFEAYCADAKNEKQRRNSKPRLIAYGGL